MTPLLVCLVFGGTLVLPAADVAGVPVDGDVRIGFFNQYNFRGFKAGDYAPWVLVDLNLPVRSNSEFALNAGGWYVNPLGDGTSEIGLYSLLVFPVAGFHFHVGGRFFVFPESGSVTGEFGASASYVVANFVDLELAWWTDVKGNGVPGDQLRFGHYAEFSAGRSFALNHWLGVDLRAGISCAIDYYGSDGLNHAFGDIAFPIGISETVTLTPYVGGTLALEGLRDAGESDYFLTGISFSVGF